MKHLKTFESYESIFEGRYDTLTRIIVRDIMRHIKDNVDSEVEEDWFELGLYTHDYSGIEFEVELILSITDSSIIRGRYTPFDINTYISVEGFITIHLVINKYEIENEYQNIYFKLNEDVRHEIEHLIQNLSKREILDEVDNPRFKNRQQPLVDRTADYRSTYLHHKDPAEVEALVHGFYRKAKLQKLPLDVVMYNDLNYEIESGNLTKDESEDLMSMFLNYSIKNLPHAKYSINI